MSDASDDLELLYRFPEELYIEDDGNEDFMDQTQRLMSMLAKFFKALIQFVKKHSNILHLRALAIKQRLYFLQDKLANRNGLSGSDLTLKITSNNDVFTVGQKSISKIMDLDREFQRYTTIINSVYDWIMNDVSYIVRQLNNILTQSFKSVDDMMDAIGRVIKAKGPERLANSLRGAVDGQGAVKTPTFMGSMKIVFTKPAKPMPSDLSLMTFKLEEVPSSKHAGGVFTRFPVAGARHLVTKLMDLCDRVREIHSAPSIKARLTDYQSLVDKLEVVGEERARDNNLQGLNVTKFDQITDQIKTIMIWGSKTQDIFSAHALRTISTIAKLCRDNVKITANTSID